MDEIIENKTRSTIQRRYIMLNETPNVNNPSHLDLIMRILHKKDIRTKPELNFLMKGFQEMKFFAEQRETLPENIYLQLFREVHHDAVNKEHVVFNFGKDLFRIIGDFGHSYYIILKGSVSVLIPKDQALKDIQMQNKQESYLTRRVGVNRQTFINRVK